MRRSSNPWVPLLLSSWVLVIMLVAGCTRTATANVLVGASIEPQLIGSTWRLAAYSDGHGSMLSVLQHAQPTAVFDANGFVTGSGGCNAYSSVYQSVVNTLSIDGPVVVAPTRMVCDQSIMDQEAGYFTALAQAMSYGLESGQLVLARSDGTPVAEFTQ